MKLLNAKKNEQETKLKLDVQRAEKNMQEKEEKEETERVAKAPKNLVSEEKIRQQKEVQEGAEKISHTEHELPKKTIRKKQVNESKKKQDASLTTRSNNIGIVVGIIVSLVVIIFGLNSIIKEISAQPTPTQYVAQEETATEQPQYVRYSIPTEGYPSLGPKDAPITIVEFGGFQDPFGKRFYQETFQALFDSYPSKIRFVYRNLPLTTIHPESFPAAVASLCANEQNLYWEYHDKLFNGDTLDRDIYVQYAIDLNLNTEEFVSCLDSGGFDDFIQQDIDFAYNLGIQSTPTFFINGLAIIGAQPLESYTQIIDKELAGETP